MQKAMLVIDMPKDCSKCPLCVEDGDVRHCRFDFYTFSETRLPEGCPLKPMPKLKQHEEEIDYEYGYIDGWNACIDTIEGETE